MLDWILAISSVIAVSAISLIGILFIWVTEKKLKKIFMYLVSFAVGGLLGDVFLHLMPEMIETGFETTTALILIAGILVSFMVERFLQWRHCHIPTSGEHPNFRLHEPLRRQRPQPNRRINHRRKLPSKHTH